MGTVRYTLDAKNPPKLSEEEKSRYDTSREEDIDYSDISELDNSFFENAWRGDMPIPVEKEKISVRLDKDILQWLRSYGRGYQTRMNEILRLAMQHHTTPPSQENDRINPQ